MELFTYTFVQYAFIGGISIAFLAGLIGPFVVHSKQSFASDMFAHVALAGIGLALVLNSSPWLGALPVLLIISTILWALEKKEKYSPDALAILFLSGGLALAIALVHVAENQVFSFENYLFGSILTLTSAELVWIVSSASIVSLILYFFWYPLIGATQNPVYKIPYNSKPEIFRLFFFWMLSIVVWIGIKTVGGLLIGALLVIPSLIVRLWSKSFKQMVGYSVLVTVASMIIGLLLSMFYDLPPSSLIIGTLIGFFLIQLLVSKFIETS